MKEIELVVSKVAASLGFKQLRKEQEQSVLQMARCFCLFTNRQITNIIFVVLIVITFHCNNAWTPGLTLPSAGDDDAVLWLVKGRTT